MLNINFATTALEPNPPWGITIGLLVILLGTLGFIFYILLLDKLEEKNAIKKGSQPKDD